MNLQFEGKITEIETPRTGATEKGEWASVSFEVTELNPQNADYPQVGFFDMFKNGEYLKYAKDFKTYYPLGTSVKVEFNLKKNEYTKKDGTPAKFYKTSAWKIEKLDAKEQTEPFEKISDEEMNYDDNDSLPF